MLKLFLIGIVVIAFIGILGNFSPQAIMTNALQNIQTSVVTAAFTGEFNEIEDIVNEFLVLREIRNSEDAQIKAAQLDEQINNLELVKSYCEEKISTLELSRESDPYERLQELCPALKSISLPKAMELFRQI
jgi:hypothetical protein